MHSLKVKQGNLVSTLTEFFQNLLRQEIVEALLLPQQLDSRATITHTLVALPDGVIAANPLAPVAPVNAARLVSELTVTDPGKKVGVVLRPCEVKALVELVKLRQASLDNLLIIGVDCLGTFEPVDYRVLLTECNFNFTSWLQMATSGQFPDSNGFKIRRACAMCDEITAGNAHLSIGWLGVDPLQELLVEGGDNLPADKFNLSPRIVLEDREKLIEGLKARRRVEREIICKEFSERVNSVEALLKELGACLRCYNCRAVCPLCSCQECIFLSPLFKHEAEKYLELADQRTFVEMPADTVLFHLTRLTHVGLSCVGCGQCETGCPGKLPLSVLFRTVGRRVQEIFNYVPGRQVEEKLPLVTYRMAELEPQ